MLRLMSTTNKLYIMKSIVITPQSGISYLSFITSTITKMQAQNEKKFISRLTKILPTQNSVKVPKFT